MSTAVAPARPEVRKPAAAQEWKSLAKIMTASAGGAVASGVLSAASTKIIASVAGPAALGLLGTLQQLRQTSLVVATANGQTALVQGLSAFQAEERRNFLRTVSIVFAGATAFVACVLLGAPDHVARWAGLDAGSAFLVQAMAAAVILSSLYVFLTAVLSAMGAAGKLAFLQLAGPGAMALLAWPVARGVREGALGMLPILLGIAAATTVLSAIWALTAYKETLREWALGSRRWWRWEACRRFFSISAVMLATGIASMAALMSARARIIHGQGLAEVGQFDAAWGISMTQASLVLASLQTHYLPGLARLKGIERTTGERGAQIARVVTLAAPVAAAVIVALALAKPAALTLLYSAAFRPAARYLRWTLLGDYFKVAGWILSIPMLAASEIRMFLAADMAASGTFAAAAAILSFSRGPAEAASIAFVLMNAVHLAICAVFARRRHGFRWNSASSLTWFAGLVFVAAVSALEWNT